MKTVRNNNALNQNKKIYPKNLTFIPLSEVSQEDLCKNINKNLFQLEKDLAYFSFAIKEIKDITKS